MSRAPYNDFAETQSWKTSSFDMVATQAQLEQTMDKVPTIAQSETPPPPPPTFPRKSRLSWKHALFCYAGAVTAALIVVSVLGSIVLQQSKAMCDTTDDSDSPDDTERNVERKNLTIKDGDKNQEEETEYDPDRDLEVILTKVNGSSRPTITVIDFKKGYMGVYEPDVEECYLFGGLDRRVSKEQDDNDNTLTLEDKDKKDQLSYKKSDDEALTDSSIMPGDLKDVCKDKPIYWMEKSCSEDAPGRQKRGCYIRARLVCYWWRCGWLRYCYRCYYYYYVLCWR